MENAWLQCSSASLRWSYPSWVRKETLRFHLEMSDATLVSDLFHVKKGSALTPPKANMLLKNDGWNIAFLLKWSLVRGQVDFRGSQRYRPRRHLQYVAEICCVCILLDRLQTCHLSGQTLGNFRSVCAIVALTSGNAVNILVSFDLEVAYLTHLLLPWHVTLQRWPTCVRSYRVSLQPESLADQAMAENLSHSFSEDWEWIDCIRVILNDDYD